MTIEVLSEKHVPSRAIARQLGVAESTVRYHLRRSREGAVDGRKEKTFAAAFLAGVIDAWCAEHGRSDRPINALDLHEFLVRVHGYRSSYKSVLRYLRARFGRPRIRTWRRVETPPGAQSQSDWGLFPDLDVGAGPERLSAFVMVLSFSRRSAVVWSRREDQVSWLACHNRAFERLGGIPAVNRIDNPKTAMLEGAGAWGTIHPTYAAYARTVGFHIDACAPYEPQQKGKTEAKVRLCRGLFASLPRRFDGIEHLQHETDERIERWSGLPERNSTSQGLAASTLERGTACRARALARAALRRPLGAAGLGHAARRGTVPLLDAHDVPHPLRLVPPPASSQRARLDDSG